RSGRIDRDQDLTGLEHPQSRSEGGCSPLQHEQYGLSDRARTEVLMDGPRDAVGVSVQRVEGQLLTPGLNRRLVRMPAHLLFESASDGLLDLLPWNGHHGDDGAGAHSSHQSIAHGLSLPSDEMADWGAAPTCRSGRKRGRVVSVEMVSNATSTGIPHVTEARSQSMRLVESRGPSVSSTTATM